MTVFTPKLVSLCANLLKIRQSQPFPSPVDKFAAVFFLSQCYSVKVRLEQRQVEFVAEKTKSCRSYQRSGKALIA